MSEQNEVLKEKSSVVVGTQSSSVPNYFFGTDEKPSSKLPSEVDRTGELVDEVLQAGIVHKVKTEDAIKEKILKTADGLIDTHLSVVKSRADKADKKSYFEANEAACSYFGYDESTTNKSHVKLMRGWSWIFNTLYIVTVGFFLVAPITFFVHKLRVVIKNNWIVILLALVIYALIVLTPFFVIWLGRV